MKFHKTLGLCLMLTVWGGAPHFAQAEGNAFKKLAAQKEAQRQQEEVQRKQQEAAANLVAAVGGGALGADVNVQNAIQAGNVQQILAAAEAVHAAGFPPHATLDLVEAGGLAAAGLQAALQRRIFEIDHNGPPADLQTAIGNVIGELGGAPGSLRARANAILAITGGADVMAGVTAAQGDIDPGQNLVAGSGAAKNAIDPAAANIPAATGNVGGVLGGPAGNLLGKANAIQALVGAPGGGAAADILANVQGAQVLLGGATITAGVDGLVRVMGAIPGDLTAQANTLLGALNRLVVAGGGANQANIRDAANILLAAAGQAPIP